MTLDRPRLLVSVRDAPEARAALAGGAALIDVKEPARGSLGRADGLALRAVLATVAGHRPVSAAAGELGEGGGLPECVRELRFLKWGLAGALAFPWAEKLDNLLAALAGSGCRLVAVGYADAGRARSPAPEEVLEYALARAGRASVGAFLLDTWDKDGSGLLDWMSPARVAGLVGECRAVGLPIALAGGLGEKEIAALRGLAPDWFAVRGAACVGGREAAVSARKVRRLADLVVGG